MGRSVRRGNDLMEGLAMTIYISSQIEVIMESPMSQNYGISNQKKVQSLLRGDPHMKTLIIESQQRRQPSAFLMEESKLILEDARAFFVWLPKPTIHNHIIRQPHRNRASRDTVGEPYCVSRCCYKLLVRKRPGGEDISAFQLYPRRHLGTRLQDA